MTLFNVTLKDSAPQEQLEKYVSYDYKYAKGKTAADDNRAKEEARKNGGTIKHEYKIIKGFTVEYPDDQVNVLETNEHIHVEQDGMVSTQ